MAYDEDLANRMRELLAAEDGLTELPMFGGLAFLLDGNMAVAVSSRGGLLVRVGGDGAKAALARKHASQMEMGGGPAKGWIRVAPEGVATKRQLATWVRRGADFARTLPPKR
jgi:TfoX/Sxy family transcriptional regulator of competence genes